MIFYNFTWFFYTFTLFFLQFYTNYFTFRAHYKKDFCIKMTKLPISIKKVQWNYLNQWNRGQFCIGIFCWSSISQLAPRYPSWESGCNKKNLYCWLKKPNRRNKYKYNWYFSSMKISIKLSSFLIEYEQCEQHSFACNSM